MEINKVKEFANYCEELFGEANPCSVIGSTLIIDNDEEKREYDIDKIQNISLNRKYLTGSEIFIQMENFDENALLWVFEKRHQTFFTMLYAIGIIYKNKYLLPTITAVVGFLIGWLLL